VQVVPAVQPEPVVPNPPPANPTIMIEVGTLLPLLNVRLFVRLICSVDPVVAVITTGDQPEELVPAAAAQVAVELLTMDPQLYPHMGTEEPSGSKAALG
jgi:hypothetical protein